MKKYNEYMDGLEASDELHRRLMDLKAPVKKAIPIRKYAAIAAALAVIIGGLSLAMDRYDRGRDDIPRSDHDLGTEDKQLPDRSGPSEPGSTEPGILEPGAPEPYPVLTFIDATGLPTAMMDYTLGPWDAIIRDAEAADIEQMMGREGFSALHWPEVGNFHGTLWFTADGTPCGVFLRGEGEDVTVELEMLVGYEVPSCIVWPKDHYSYTQLDGVEIRAFDMGENRLEVSFLTDNVGYKATFSGESDTRGYAAAFVWYAIEGGIDFSGLSAEGSHPLISAPSNTLYYSELPLPEGEADPDILAGLSGAAGCRTAFDEPGLANCVGIVEGTVKDMYVKEYSYQMRNDKFGNQGIFTYHTKSLVVVFEIEKTLWGAMDLCTTIVLENQLSYSYSELELMKVGHRYVVPVWMTDEDISLVAGDDQFVSGDVTRESPYAVYYPYHPQIEVTLDGDYIVPADWESLTLPPDDARFIVMDVEEYALYDLYLLDETTFTERMNTLISTFD